MHQYSSSYWDEIIARVRQLPPHTDVRVEKWEVGSIPDGFYRRLGDPDWQTKDYGYELPDGSGIHVKVYSDHYKIHWDKTDPKRNPIRHLYEDAPHWLVAGIIGAVMTGLILYKRAKN